MVDNSYHDWLWLKPINHCHQQHYQPLAPTCCDSNQSHSAAGCFPHLLQVATVATLSPTKVQFARLGHNLQRKLNKVRGILRKAICQEPQWLCYCRFVHVTTGDRTGAGFTATKGFTANAENCGIQTVSSNQALKLVHVRSKRLQRLHHLHSCGSHGTKFGHWDQLLQAVELSISYMTPPVTSAWTTTVLQITFLELPSRVLTRCDLDFWFS